MPSNLFGLTYTVNVIRHIQDDVVFPRKVAPVFADHLERQDKDSWVRVANAALLLKAQGTQGTGHKEQGAVPYLREALPKGCNCPLTLCTKEESPFQC